MPAPLTGDPAPAPNLAKAPEVTADPPPPVTADPDDKPLGDAGEKALEAWKARAKSAEADAKRAKDLQAEVDALKAAQMSDQEKAVAEARKEAADAARTEALASVNGRLFRSELKAAVAAKLNESAIADLLIDTDVALKLLALDEIPVTADGDIDSAAIAQHVDAYAAARPHLAASATQTPGPIDQGPRPTGQPAKSIDEQIAEAEAANDWKRSRSLKTQQLLAAPRG